MAVTEKYKTSMQLVFDIGTDELTGKPIYKLKNFNNVKVDTTADQLYAIAQALTPLQDQQLDRIERKDAAEIRES